MVAVASVDRAYMQVCKGLCRTLHLHGEFTIRHLLLLFIIIDEKIGEETRQKQTTNRFQRVRCTPTQLQWEVFCLPRHRTQTHLCSRRARPAGWVYQLCYFQRRLAAQYAQCNEKLVYIQHVNCRTLSGIGVVSMRNWVFIYLQIRTKVCFWCPPAFSPFVG